MAASRVALIALGVAALAVSVAPDARAQLVGAPAPPLAGLDLYMPARVAPNAGATIALGRQLFFDPVLSRDSTVACATCHQPSRAFSDGQPLARGVHGRVGGRNTPTIVNRGYATAFSLDGRANRLESQALRAIQDSVEMDLPLDSAVERLARSRRYAAAFQAIGRAPSAESVASALAEYLRSVMAGDSRFDRFGAGDRSALTPLERRGLDLFQTRAGCDRCHSGSLLSDEQFHNTGVAWRDDAFRDAGRFAVTGQPRDRGAFKTPTLRQIAETAPYMHDGSLATLEQVVDFYDRGGNANPNLDDRIRPLRLSDTERAALVAFLRTLSGVLREGK
jgi:cytochrome c peroxidase